MKFSSMAAAVLTVPTAALPFSRRAQFSSSVDLGSFLLPKSSLTTLASEPPSFISSSETTSGPTVDIVSIGSVTRMDYLTAQIETWGSHKSVRHFWGFSELQDLDPQCVSSTEDEVQAFVDKCRAIQGELKVGEGRTADFFAENFGRTEGGRVRSDAGWVCAQRRPGRALGWLNSQYGGGVEAPDYLVLVDDDSFLNVGAVVEDLEEKSAAAAAGCMFGAGNSSPIPFGMPYGGFGTVLTKSAITQLSTPIHCDADLDVSDNQVCSLIKADTIGEASIFEDGMTLFELFYLYSSKENYCFHSDWLMGYIINNYVQADAAQESPLVAIEAYPACGNITYPTGETRYCTKDSMTCHNIDPEHMEFLALNSYTKSQEDFQSIPMLSSTSPKKASQIVKSLEEEAAPKAYAYATVLGWNPDRESNKMYLDAVRILLASLKSSKVADFVVLMTHDDDSAENLLKSEGAIVKHIDRMEYSNDASEFEPWFTDIALAKLRAFEMTGYDRVQVLDADSSVSDVSAMDDLFTSYAGVNLVAEGLGKDSPLRAGWLMIQPSQTDFDNMEELLARGVFTSEHGWDNLDLAVEYPGWEGLSDEESHGWNFYGSQLEQGLLFHYFYALPKSKNPLAADLKLVTLLNDQTLHSHGFIHFYGNRKPWVKGSNSGSTFVTAQNRWLKAYQNLRTTTSVVSSHQLPLTEYGAEKYSRVLQAGYYTSEPTAAPITSEPTAAPITSEPTAAPITSEPTAAPITSEPTAAPITSEPTAAPITSEPTAAPVSSAPVTSPPTTPTPQTTTIQMDSTLQWNITCSEITDEELVQVAQIIEQSTHDGMDPNMPEDTFLKYVYVYELCGRPVEEHDGFPTPVRRLQTSALTSDIKMYHLVEKECDFDCSEEMFDGTDAALATIVDDGSLSESIQAGSNDIITAVINGKSNSTFVVQTSSPTTQPSKSPSTSPTEFVCDVVVGTECSGPLDMSCLCAGLECFAEPTSPTGFACKEEESQGTYAPSKHPTSNPTPRPTPIPTIAKSSKQTKSSKVTPSPVTPSPITPKPVTPRPTAAKSNKSSKVFGTTPTV